MRMKTVDFQKLSDFKKSKTANKIPKLNPNNLKLSPSNTTYFIKILGIFQQTCYRTIQ